MDIKIGADNTVKFENGAFSFTSDDADLLRQRLYIRLCSHKEDWFLNIDYGVNWFNQDVEKGYTKTALDLIIQNEILKDSLSEAITSFVSYVANSTYYCDFAVRLKSGNTLQSSLNSGDFSFI